MFAATASALRHRRGAASGQPTGQRRRPRPRTPDRLQPKRRGLVGAAAWLELRRPGPATRAASTGADQRANGPCDRVAAVSGAQRRFGASAVEPGHPDSVATGLALGQRRTGPNASGCVRRFAPTLGALQRRHAVLRRRVVLGPGPIALFRRTSAGLGRSAPGRHGPDVRTRSGNPVANRSAQHRR